MLKISSNSFVALMVLVPSMFVSSCFAADAKLSSKYTLSFVGLPVGTMKTSTKLKDDTYKISGSVRTNRMVSVIASTKAGFSSEGRIAGARLIPDKHALEYKAKKKKSELKMVFASGNVIKSVAKPFKKLKPDAVPVKKDDLRAVLDPISSLLFPVLTAGIGDGRQICNRIVPVYDGRARMNLVFSFVSSKKQKAKGFNGNTFKCAIRYHPVSGHRPSKKGVKFMKENRDMSVTVARIGNSTLYGLFAFEVRTEKGTASGYATKFASK